VSVPVDNGFARNSERTLGCALALLSGFVCMEVIINSRAGDDIEMVGCDPASCRRVHVGTASEHSCREHECKSREEA